MYKKYLNLMTPSTIVRGISDVDTMLHWALQATTANPNFKLKWITSVFDDYDGKTEFNRRDNENSDEPNFPLYPVFALYLSKILRENFPTTDNSNKAILARHWERLFRMYGKSFAFNENESLHSHFNDVENGYRNCVIYPNIRSSDIEDFKGINFIFKRERKRDVDAYLFKTAKKNVSTLTNAQYANYINSSYINWYRVEQIFIDLLRGITNAKNGVILKELLIALLTLGEHRFIPTTLGSISKPVILKSELDVNEKIMVTECGVISELLRCVTWFLESRRDIMSKIFGSDDISTLESANKRLDRDLIVKYVYENPYIQDRITEYYRELKAFVNFLNPEKFFTLTMLEYYLLTDNLELYNLVRLTQILIGIRIEYSNKYESEEDNIGLQYAVAGIKADFEDMSLSSIMERGLYEHIEHTSLYGEEPRVVMSKLCSEKVFESIFGRKDVNEKILYFSHEIQYGDNKTVDALVEDKEKMKTIRQYLGLLMTSFHFTSVKTKDCYLDDRMYKNNVYHPVLSDPYHVFDISSFFVPKLTQYMKDQRVIIKDNSLSKMPIFIDITVPCFTSYVSNPEELEPEEVKFEIEAKMADSIIIEKFIEGEHCNPYQSISNREESYIDGHISKAILDRLNDVYGVDLNGIENVKDEILEGIPNAYILPLISEISFYQSLTTLLYYAFDGSSDLTFGASIDNLFDSEVMTEKFIKFSKEALENIEQF